jgi:hypothetical protein
MHNTGLATAHHHFMFIQMVFLQLVYLLHAHRLARVDLASNETFFFEMNYPLVLVNQEKIVVEVTAPASGGAGIGSVVNYQVLGDTDI